MRRPVGRVRRRTVLAQTRWRFIALALGMVVIALVLERSATAPIDADVGTSIPVSGVGQHVHDGDPISYAQLPPVGGPHWPTPAPWGVSLQTIPDERIVHNLEHGGVVISINGIADAALQRLRSLLDEYPRDRYGEVKVVVRPYDKIPVGTIVLTAWGWTRTLPSVDEAKIKTFLGAHLDRCCENVP